MVENRHTCTWGQNSILSPNSSNHTPPITHHTSHVSCHTPHLTHHTSHVSNHTPNLSHLKSHASPHKSQASNLTSHISILLNIESLATPVTGIGRYTLELLRGLAEAEEVEDLRCFNGHRFLSPSGAGDRMSPGRDRNPAPPARKRRLPALRRLLRDFPGAYPLRAGLSNCCFRAGSARHRQAVYLEPNYILKSHPGPSVATVHDLSHLRFPEFHPRARQAWLKKNLAPSLERADMIITVSHYIKKEIMDFFGISGSGIAVTPLGVDRVFRPCSGEESREVLARYGLEMGGYILTVGTREPRKNLDRLLRAYQGLPGSLRRSFPLVLAGPAGWGRRRDRPGEGVHFPGYVAEADLPFLYSGAAGFVYPSLYEGFGLPPLEAMACGTPVLISNTSALPEVAGSAALQVDPLDTRALTRTLERLLTDEQFREEASRLGPARAAGFTWENCLTRTLEVLARV